MMVVGPFVALNQREFVRQLLHPFAVLPEFPCVSHILQDFSR